MTVSAITTIPATQTAQIASALMTDSGQIAVLIDWENIKYSLRELNGTKPAPHLLARYLRPYGRIAVGYAYANWSNPELAPDIQGLWRAGIEPVLVHGRFQGHGKASKNGADVRLAVDAIDLCHQQPAIDTYVLVSGDADLVHPLLYLRRHGKRTIVAAIGASLGKLLASTADEVIHYERQIIELAEPEPTEFDRSTVAAWVATILRESEGPCPYARLGNELKLRHGFDPKAALGMPLGQLMQELAASGTVTLQTIGGHGYATLPESGPTLLASVS